MNLQSSHLPFSVSRDASGNGLLPEGECYVSYPLSTYFRDDFTEADYQRIAKRRFRKGAEHPLGLDVNIPVLDELQAGRDRQGASATYIAHLACEIAMRAPLFESRARVEQLHLGGPGASALDDAQLAWLMRLLCERFTFAPDSVGEYVADFEVTSLTAARVAQLRALGFNQLKLRVRGGKKISGPAGEQIMAMVAAARRASFTSVSIDLALANHIDLLPGADENLAFVLALLPERIAVHRDSVPPCDETHIGVKEGNTVERMRDRILELAAMLDHAGFVHIGLLEFARKGSALANARQKGALHHHLLGYSTRRDVDTLGLGMAAVGRMGGSYCQNSDCFDEYYSRLESGHLPIQRGIELSDDDQIRREIIQQLLCESAVDFPNIERRWGVVFATYFERELTQLCTQTARGLVQLSPGRLALTPAGRLLLADIAAVFDHYRSNCLAVAVS